MLLQKRLGSLLRTSYDMPLLLSSVPCEVFYGWLTCGTKIAMSSVTPLAGRLSLIFTPRVFVFFSSLVLSLGLFITALARNITVFLLGRAVSGCGCGGLMSTSIILVLDLASKRRRGLCFGMINSGYTIGVASGAVLAGLLTPAYGWVRGCICYQRKRHIWLT